MSKHGDQTPPKGPDQNPPVSDLDQTLPEGAFDKTLPEGLAEPAPAGDGATVVVDDPFRADGGVTTVGNEPTHADESATVVSDEPAHADEGATMLGDEPAHADEGATMLGDEPAHVDEGATMLGDEPAHADEGATMVGDEPAHADEGATMVGFGADATGQNSGDFDADKTLPDGVLAVLADDDYSMKTIMMDDIAASEENAPPEEDFGKTLPDGAFDQFGGDGFAEKTKVLDSTGGTAEGTLLEDDGTKTLPEGAFGSFNAAGTTMLEDGSAPANQDDGFGKTIQADAFGKTIATDGTIAPEPLFDGKTMVGPDSAVEGEIHANVPTVADPKLRRPGDSVVRSHATHTGGKTSIDGTDVVGSETVEGIDKDSLNVAMRSISGLQYGAIPRVDFKLVKQLGEGGMGVVYVARQQSLGREVVFKTLKPMAEAQASKMKASGTMNSVIKHRTDMFLSEAVVTADLFHPNIVPIYELAKAPDGSLFYTMKWVRGDGWNKRLKEMTLEENLEVLMKVSDAMGFAHSRNIINRDLKPENVMLGGYGETIVFDWGLALPVGEGKKRLPIATFAGLGSGTPAYMPPELITGPLAKIGPACDIYLLGAMLFEVVTGVPPHDFSSRQSGGTMSAGAKLAEVRRVVVDNIIRETEKKGELIDIAMKAMATKPEDRYRTVVDFQNAIRDYMKHAASHTLADRAKEMTTVAAPIATEAKPTTEAKPAAEAPSVGYTNYQNAVALYNESLREWSGNDVARVGLTETQKNFAELALVKGDFDLGLAVLDTKAESHSETRSKLLLARQEREGRVRRMTVLKRTAIVLLIGFAGVSALAAKGQFDLAATEKKQLAAEKKEGEAKEDQKKADAQRIAADAQRIAAVAQKEKAVELALMAEGEKKTAEMESQKAKKETAVAQADTMKAEVARADADKAKAMAVAAALVAKTEQAKAEVAEKKAAYKAGLADASRVIYEGDYKAAREKLNRLKNGYDEKLLGPIGPEWKLLMDAANAPQAVWQKKPVESIGMSGDGRKLVAGYGDRLGNIVVWPIDGDGNIRDDQPIRSLELGTRLRAVAMSYDGVDIAAAGDDGVIRVWSLAAPDKLPRISLKGHGQPVYALKFSRDGKRLASGSDDRTVRLWSVEKDCQEEKRQLVVSETVLYGVKCVDWSRDGQWLVAGTSTKNEVSGVAYSWKVQANANQLSLLPIRQFQVVPKGNKEKPNGTEEASIGQEKKPDGQEKKPDPTEQQNDRNDKKIVQNCGVVAIALTDDGKYAVSNGPAAELHLWQVNPPTKEGQKPTKGLDKKFPLKINTEATVKLGEHSSRVERVRSVAFSEDSSQLLVAGDDGTISIWDRNDDKKKLPYEKREKPIYGHGGSVRGCLPLPNSSDLIIISGSYDQNVHSLNVSKYLKVRGLFENPPKEPGRPAAFRPADSDVSVLDNSCQSETSGCGSDGPTEPVPSENVLASFPRSDKDNSKKTTAPEEPSASNVEPRRSVQFNAKNEGLGHRDSVYSAAFSRDGKRVISASRDQTARVWNSETGLPVNTVTGQPTVFNDDDDNVFQEGHALDLFVMRFFPDGEKLLTTGFDGEVRIWDSRIDNDKSFGRELAVLPDTSMYGVVDISSDGQWILTAGRGSSARREKTAGQKEAKYEAQAQLWNTKDVLASRRPMPKLTLDNVHRFRVTTVAISPDNTRLLTGDREGRIVLWDAKTGKVVGQPRNAHSGEVVKSVFLGKDGSRLLTAGVDRSVVLWNVVKTGTQFVLEKIRQFDQEGMVVNLEVSSKEDRFISVIRLGDKQTKNNNSKASITKVSLWNIESGKERVIDVSSRDADSRTKGERDRDRPPFPAWAANGTEAIITTSEGITVKGTTTSEGTIHFYDSEKGEITQSLRVDNGGGVDGADYRAEPFAAILRPDEPTPLHLLTQTHRAAYLWRLQAGQNLVGFRPQGGENIVSFRPQGPVFSAGYSSDGRFVVTGGRSVRIFDANELNTTYGRLLHKVEYPHAGMVTSAEFSPAVKSFRFLTTSYDGTAKIWEWLPNRKFARLIVVLTGHDGPVRFGTWSSDGLRVLTVGHDASPHVWSIEDGKAPKLVVLEIPKAVAASTAADTPPEENTKRDFDQLCGAFSWDGQFVAVGGRDADTDESIGWIWNLTPGDGKNPELYATIRGHGLGGINSVAFLPNTKLGLASLQGLGGINTVEFLPKDDRLLTGGADGTARLWDWQKSAVNDNNGKVVEADFLISLVRPNLQPTTHRGPVTSVRVTSTGNIVTASSDGTILIWPK